MSFDKGEKKALMLFEDHMKSFSNFLGSYRMGSDEYKASCYFENYSKYSRTKISYMVNKKFLSNTYFMDLTFIMDDLHMAADWEAKLVFKGTVKMTGAKLKHVGGEKAIVDMLNTNGGFFEKIVDFNKKVDIYSMTFKYNVHTAQLRIIITPYNGGYLWIKLPPVFYPMRFSMEEIYYICKMLNFLGTSFVREN